MEWKKRIAIALLLGVLLGGFQIALAADAGTITGKITFKGKAPEVQKLAINKDTAVCGSETQLDELVVGPNQGVRYVVVHLAGATSETEPPKAAEIEQKGCRFNPHIVILGKGGNLDILNNDGILHNLHSRSSVNPPFNKAQPAFRKRLTQKLDQAEIFKLTCDVHTWMGAWIVVSENSFVAVTDESGSFKLPNVPPGSYKLEIWHEKLGKHVQDITVKAGGETSVALELPLAKT